MTQVNRRYRLIVGDYNSREALEIKDHQLTFDISRSSDYRQKMNSAAIEIYNLSNDEEAFIAKDYIGASLEVRYGGAVDESSFVELFSGNVVRSSTKKSGADRVTQIIMGEGYTDLSHNPSSATVPEGKTVEDVVKQALKAMPNIKRGKFSGTNLNSKLLYGYPIQGNGKQILDDLCKTYGVKYHIHNNKLYVYDNKGSIQNPKSEAPLVTKDTGLIDTPFAITGDKGKKITDKSQLRGIQFRKLIDTQIICGMIIKVEDGDINGWYVVDEIRYSGDYRGNMWYMDVIATEISDFNIQGAKDILTAQKELEGQAELEAATVEYQAEE